MIRTAVPTTQNTTKAASRHTRLVRLRRKGFAFRRYERGQGRRVNQGVLTAAELPDTLGPNLLAPRREGRARLWAVVGAPRGTAVCHQVRIRAHRTAGRRGRGSARAREVPGGGCSAARELPE